MKVLFYLRFHTEFGETLLLTGNTDELGNDDFAKALPMTYLNEQFWTGSIELRSKKLSRFQYKYILKTKDGEIIPEFGTDRTGSFIKHLANESGIDEIMFIDTWNHAGEYENAFFTAPFQKTLLRENATAPKPKPLRNASHIFKV